MNNSAAAVATAIRACDIAPDSIQAKQLLVRMLLADLQPRKAQETLDAMLEMEPNERQQQQINSLQFHTRNMRRQAQNRPLKWLKRKLKKRIANVTSEA